MKWATVDSLDPISGHLPHAEGHEVNQGPPR
nr:MAG TPA: hypothetical protein [Caudoviricetes sp.]